MQPGEYIIYTVVSHSQLTVYDDILPGTAWRGEQSLQGTVWLRSVARSYPGVTLTQPVPTAVSPSLSPVPSPCCLQSFPEASLPQHLPTCSLSLSIPPPQSRTVVLSGFPTPASLLIPPCHLVPTTLEKSRGSQLPPQPSTPLPHLCPQVLLPRNGMRAPNCLSITAPP